MTLLMGGKSPSMLSLNLYLSSSQHGRLAPASHIYPSAPRERSGRPETICDFGVLVHHRQTRSKSRNRAETTREHPPSVETAAFTHTQTQSHTWPGIPHLLCTNGSGRTNPTLHCNSGRRTLYFCPCYSLSFPIRWRHNCRQEVVKSTKTNTR